MYHAIVINKQFLNPNYPNSLKVFSKKIDGDWEIYGVEVEDSNKEDFIKNVQENMRPNETWYAHMYNDSEMIVIFRDKVFLATPNQSSWSSIFEYGKSLGIPEKQLDFWPNRFQDEKHYFTE